MNIKQGREILGEEFDSCPDELIEKLIELIGLTQDYLISECISNKKTSSQGKKTTISIIPGNGDQNS